MRTKLGMTALVLALVAFAAPASGQVDETDPGCCPPDGWEIPPWDEVQRPLPPPWTAELDASFWDALEAWGASAPASGDLSVLEGVPDPAAGAGVLPRTG